MNSNRFNGPQRPLNRPRKRPNTDLHPTDSLLANHQYESEVTPIRIKLEHDSCSDTDVESEVIYERRETELETELRKELRQMKDILREKDEEIRSLKDIVEKNLNKHTNAVMSLEEKLEDSEKRCIEAFRRIGLLIVNYPESHLNFKRQCTFGEF